MSGFVESKGLIALGNAVDILFDPKEIVTEHYTLRVVRSADRTQFEYQPKGYWSTSIITGRIYLKDHYNREENKVIEKLELNISHSSGGQDKDWDIDCELSYIEAYKDCYDRVKNHTAELEHLKMRRKKWEEYEEKRNAERDAYNAEILAKRPILDDAEIKKVVKEAATLGTYGMLKWWEFVPYRGEFEQKECAIRSSGIHLFSHGSRGDSQKRVVEYLSGRVVELKVEETVL